MVSQKKKLGDILIEKGLITEEILKRALANQEKTGEKLGEILLKMGLIKEEDLYYALSEIYNVPYVNLEEIVIDSDVVRLIPEHISRRYKIIPIRLNGDRIVLAMANPVNIYALDDVRIITGREVEPVLASEKQINQALDKIYTIQKGLEETLLNIAPGEEETETPVEVLEDEAPVVRLVNLTITQAVQEGASDIHIEPTENEVKVRFRVDGVLYDVMSPPKRIFPTLVARIKILANMDIAERRLPQDGRFRVTSQGKIIDFRVSTLPTIHGEKIVLRLLDRSAPLIGLEKLGFTEDVLEKFDWLIQRPYGMILVTGPTGSGKTTTLYSALAKISTPEKNIITVEDPVEYQFPRINQVQVNTKIGLTFANGLRSILRQDPDIIMIGEIRDRETAEIAVQSALTGHLVLSTIHTNDSAGAIARLMDMGIEPFLISSSVIGILAQRLARRICSRCKVPKQPTEEEIKVLKLGENDVIYEGRGCEACRHTGYRGRIGIFELLMIDDEIRAMIVDKVPANVIRDSAVKKGMRTLWEDAKLKVRNGVTTYNEILRTVYAGGL
ncbi:MAG: type II secretion system ATPase GspE [bacterium]|nr:type II secretion system ATPase GspE [bacterium]